MSVPVGLTGAEDFWGEGTVRNKSAEAPVVTLGKGALFVAGVLVENMLANGSNASTTCSLEYTSLALYPSGGDTCRGGATGACGTYAGKG